MRRLRLAFALFPGVLCAAACSGSVNFTGDGDGGPTADAAPDQVARDQFQSMVKPILDQSCASCHVSGAAGAPKFMEPNPDLYTTITTWVGVMPRIMGQPLLSCADPAQSPLVTYGAHAGPAFTVEQLPVVRMWAETWQSVSPTCQGQVAAKAVTASFTPVTGPNTLPLDNLGPGLEGATLTFNLDTLPGPSLYLSEIKFNAGANGLRVIHPIFEYCINATETAEPNDKFKNVMLDVGPNMVGQPGDGTLTLVQVPPNTPLAVRFTEITPQAGAQGDPVDNGGSCP